MRPAEIILNKNYCNCFQGRRPWHCKMNLTVKSLKFKGRVMFLMFLQWLRTLPCQLLFARVQFQIRKTISIRNSMFFLTLQARDCDSHADFRNVLQ